MSALRSFPGLLSLGVALNALTFGSVLAADQAVPAKPTMSATSTVKKTVTAAPSQTKPGGTASTKMTVNSTVKSQKTTTAGNKTTQVKSKKVTRLKIEVPCRAWLPKGVQPKVVLLCVHGLGLNSKSYEAFGNQMKAEGIGVFAVDVRGFGTWMQLKGKANCDFNSCLGDVQQALKVLHQAYPEKKVFILGESMGGAIAMRVAADHQESIDGLISCVPSGDRFHKTKNELNVALHLVTLRGKKPIDVGTKVIEDATVDPVQREKWEDDPFNRLKLSSKELLQFQRFMNKNHETAKRIDKVPVLFLVGLGDKLVKPKGTVELFEEVTSPDKNLITVKSAEHLIFEQHTLTPELKRVLVDWLLSHAVKH